eukprot:TRINITY_DN2894_c1_g1_i1.p1 TRINITY_DN2894_c1_g1~~TRINITY_DN2894_c1_g1_i1.p1  ORF type:complete len:456 (+),score=148.81 TRINITY_DN2894_c1_g1_i1:84-1451(+)
MAPGPNQVNPALAGRIQGYGNFNPPPLEEDNAKTMAKKVLNNTGEMLGEEIALTVQDFREKGAVGAVKDAVVDAGDILIDGAASIIGWLRGEPPAEDDEDTAAKAEDASKVLEHGPAGAAYGMQQASPTGGINAVWVMPEDADPAMLAEVAQQKAQQRHQATPPGIQPYMPHGVPSQPFQPMPGGPVIAPYQPEPPKPKHAGFVPGMFPGAPKPAGFVPPGAGGFSPPGGISPGGFSPGGFSPGGFSPGGFAPGGFAPGSGYSPGASSSGSGSSLSGAKRLVEQVSKGELIPGPEVAKRLMTTCAAAKLTPKQLSEVVCERARRLYLGLESSVSDTDGGLMRLLKLADALKQLDSGMARDSVTEIVEGVKEEFTSLQSNAQYKTEAAACLQRLGMSKQAPAEMADLLGDEPAKPAANGASVDLLGGGGSNDLLDMGGSAPAAAPANGGTGNLLDF